MSNDAVREGRVVVFGSANRDHVLAVEAFPHSGETVLSSSYSVGLGGKGANQAVAAAREGATVSFVGAVGPDESGDAVIGNLSARGIDTGAIMRSEAAATGVAIVLVDSTGSNEIIVAPGANAEITEEAVAATADALMPADIVVVQCEISPKRVEQVIRASARRGASVVLNLAPYTELSHTVFSDVGVLVVNESEARSLLGAGADADTDDLATAVSALHDCDCIVTLGERGSVYASTNGSVASVPANRVEDVVDTTGAGDVYVGTLAAALVRRDDIVKAMRSASTAAARSVATPGAQAQHSGASAPPQETPVHAAV